MKRGRGFLLITMALIIGAGVCHAQTTSVVGAWKIDVSFQNGQTRSLRFDARPAGQGSLVLLVPPQNQIGANSSSSAEWKQNGNDSLTVSGSVKFPLGNVGIERGTLILHGKLQNDGSLTGEAELFPPDQVPKGGAAKPLKIGTFKATRLSN